MMGLIKLTKFFIPIKQMIIIIEITVASKVLFSNEYFLN